MNSSAFMDKQITALSGSLGGGGDFFDLLNPEERHQSSSNGGGIGGDEILAGYDLQPIRGTGSPSPPAVTGLDSRARQSRSSDESHTGSSSLKFTGITESREVTKVSHEKERDAYDAAKMAEIDHTVKKHTDSLLLALEGVSSRLSQIESRTHHLETYVGELKVSVETANGSTDGKLRQLENILREVQTGVQVLRDKQEISETRPQLAKLQASEEHPPPKQSHTAKLDSQQQTPPPPVLISQVPIAPPQPPQLPSLPAPNAPPSAPSQQNSSVQFPAQFPQSQVPSLSSLSSEPYFLQLAQSTDTAHQHNQTPAQQSQQLPQALHYQPLPQMPQFSLPTRPPHPVHPSLQFQPTLPHHSEELPPPKTYTTNIRLAVPPTQAPSVPPPPQQYYGPNRSMYEPPLNRPVSRHGSFSASYDPASGPSFSDPYPNSGSPSRYSSSASPSGGSNYRSLPTAQILPQALPTGSSSGSTNGNRVPIDDVVDKVSTMGFSREQVRATVRKLTENGQSVDLNVVLDKLMNGGEIQPQKGWFGR